MSKKDVILDKIFGYRCIICSKELSTQDQIEIKRIEYPISFPCTRCFFKYCFKCVNWQNDVYWTICCKGRRCIKNIKGKY